MRVELYVIELSHPAFSARLMLEHKGIEHEVVSLLAGLHPVALRLAGFSGGTVPALKADGKRVQGTLLISRFLDRLQPDPPLFPADPEQARRVEAAETWGGEVLQPVPRRLFRWALVRDRRVRRLLARRNRMPVPALAAVVLKPVAKLFARASRADDATVRRDLAALPALLDHADELIEAGIIGADEPNAATFQIAPSLRLLMNFAQLRPLLADRPAARFARELLPDYPGEEIPAVYPSAWLEP